MARLHGIIVGAVSTALLSIAGCYDYANDCLWNGACVVGTKIAGGGGGGGGTVDPACVPSANKVAVDASCGVFVSSSAGDDAAEGTPDKPVLTLAKALSLASGAGKPVYACAEAFAENVKLPAGTTLYGGLDCKAGWTYVGLAMKTSIAPSVDAAAVTQIAVVLQSGVGMTHVEDVAITAPDAGLLGGSSIAALADGATAELVRCELVAGNARAGAKGETPSTSVGPQDPNDVAIKGANGAAACGGDAVNGNAGGSGMTNALCSMSVGGAGGVGKEANGEAGVDGTPLPMPNPDGWGVGGIGATVGACKPGEPGFLGADGVSGNGALSSSHGVLSSTGFVGVDGSAGSDGAPGQGGGGGGGAKGKLNCNGASGGGGGAGGCGGHGGLGGQGGGASIALASLAASVTLKDVKLSSGNGGDGGEGGDGQNGGIGGFGGGGGLGAAGTLAACAGGQGGQGGFGGKGGGGRGGPSVGIAFTGTSPSIEGGSIATGQPGKGGLGADAAGTGADGTKADTLELAGP